MVLCIGRDLGVLLKTKFIQSVSYDGKSKKRAGYVKKRVFCGNQHVNKKKAKHSVNTQQPTTSCNNVVQSPVQVGPSDRNSLENLRTSTSFEDSEGYRSSIS